MFNLEKLFCNTHIYIYVCADTYAVADQFQLTVQLTGITNR